MRANLGFIFQALLAARFFFRESISQRALSAIFMITLASIFLSTNFEGGFAFSLGALGVVLACVLWGVDNNFTRSISAKDPLTIVAWKGLVAGTFSLLLGLALGQQLPTLSSIHAFLPASRNRRTRRLPNYETTKLGD